MGADEYISDPRQLGLVEDIAAVLVPQQLVDKDASTHEKLPI